MTVWHELVGAQKCIPEHTHTCGEWKVFAVWSAAINSASNYSKHKTKLYYVSLFIFYCRKRNEQKQHQQKHSPNFHNNEKHRSKCETSVAFISLFFFSNNRGNKSKWICVATFGFVSSFIYPRIKCKVAVGSSVYELSFIHIFKCGTNDG